MKNILILTSKPQRGAMDYIELLEAFCRARKFVHDTIRKKGVYRNYVEIDTIISNSTFNGLLEISNICKCSMRVWDTGTKDMFEKDLIGVVGHNKIDIVLMLGFNWILSEKYIDQLGHKTFNLTPTPYPDLMGLAPWKRMQDTGSEKYGPTMYSLRNKPPRFDSKNIIFAKHEDIKKSDLREYKGEIFLESLRITTQEYSKNLLSNLISKLAIQN